MSFNKEKAQSHLDHLLSLYSIEVVKWSVASCGRAWIKAKKIKIPRPTNVDRFCVAMHEIRHITYGRRGLVFEQEFECDMFAMQQAEMLGFPVDDWKLRMNWHCLMTIAKAVNRGLQVKKIRKDIREWFPTIDFEKWQGNSVFVYPSKDNPGYRVTITEKLSALEVKRKLNAVGYGLYMKVGGWYFVYKANNNITLGYTFPNLGEVMEFYEKLEKPCEVM